MDERLMLKCLIALILGYFVARMIRGDGFSDVDTCIYPISDDNIKNFTDKCINNFTELKTYAVNHSCSNAGPDCCGGGPCTPGYDWGPIDPTFKESSIKQSCDYIKTHSWKAGNPLYSNSWKCGPKLSGSSNECTRNLSDANLAQLQGDCKYATTAFIEWDLGISTEHNASAVDMVCNNELFNTIKAPSSNKCVNCDSILKVLCSKAKTISSEKCEQCAGMNQAKLVAAGCTPTIIDEWCSK